MAVDHYTTLGVTPAASPADLRGAYLKLARSNHPDKFDDGEDRKAAESRMQEINEAWNVLGVAHKRREYDGARPRAARAQATPGSSSQQRGRAHFHPFDDEPVTRPDIDLDATPIPGSKGMPRWMAFMPVLFIGSGVVMFAFGTMVRAGGVLAVGFISVLLGLISFLLLPLFVMSRAERDPNL